MTSHRRLVIYSYYPSYVRHISHDSGYMQDVFARIKTNIITSKLKKSSGFKYWQCLNPEGRCLRMMILSDPNYWPLWKSLFVKTGNQITYQKLFIELITWLNTLLISWLSWSFFKYILIAYIMASQNSRLFQWIWFIDIFYKSTDGFIIFHTSLNTVIIGYTAMGSLVLADIDLAVIPSHITSFL